MRKLLLSVLLVLTVALVGLTPSRADAQLFRRWRSAYYYPSYYYPSYSYAGYYTPAYVAGYDPYASSSSPSISSVGCSFGILVARSNSSPMLSRCRRTPKTERMRSRSSSVRFV